MQISIISVGKLKEKYLQMGVEEFRKRLTPYCKLELVEVADEPAPDHLKAKEVELVKQREGERLLQHINADHYVVALAIDGVTWSSERFAEELEKLATYGHSQIVFVIGGSHGLGDNLLQRADRKLSLSQLTFPHQLARLILLEQIYRAFKIIRKEPYHK